MQSSSRGTLLPDGHVQAEPHTAPSVQGLGEAVRALCDRGLCAVDLSVSLVPRPYRPGSQGICRLSWQIPRLNPLTHYDTLAPWSLGLWGTLTKLTARAQFDAFTEAFKVQPGAGPPQDKRIYTSRWRHGMSGRCAPSEPM